MIPIIRDLFEHLVWADSELLTAIRTRAGAFDDEEIKKWLHHIVSVERFFLALLLGRAPDNPREQPMPPSLEEMQALFRDAHVDALQFVSQLTDEDLSRTVELPRMKEFRPQTRDVLIQIAMHSEHHRAQCAMRLRALGGAPTVTDYIKWVRTVKAATAAS